MLWQFSSILVSHASDTSLPFLPLLILLYLFTLLISCLVFKKSRPQNVSFSVASYSIHHGPNIFLRTWWTNTVSLCTTVNVIENDQVLHPHKTTCKIILQCLLNFSHHPAYIQHAITVTPKTILTYSVNKLSTDFFRHLAKSLFSTQNAMCFIIISIWFVI
jgi:hypothetical protein